MGEDEVLLKLTEKQNGVPVRGQERRGLALQKIPVNG